MPPGKFHFTSCRSLFSLFMQSFRLYPNGPDKSQQLATNRGYHLPFYLAPDCQFPIASVQTMLRLPSDFTDFFADLLLSLPQSFAYVWPVPVRPSSLYDYSP